MSSYVSQLREIYCDDTGTGSLHTLQGGSIRFLVSKTPWSKRIFQWRLMWPVSNTKLMLFPAFNTVHISQLYLDFTGTFVKGMLVEDLCPFGVTIYRNKGNITWNQKLQWAIQILQGLMHVHAEGLVMGKVNYIQLGLRYASKRCDAIASFNFSYRIAMASYR